VFVVAPLQRLTQEGIQISFARAFQVRYDNSTVVDVLDSASIAFVQSLAERVSDGLLKFAGSVS
jgi:hypothetical protein